MLDGIEESPRELTAFELVTELELELEPRDMHGVDKLALQEKAAAEHDSDTLKSA